MTDAPGISAKLRALAVTPGFQLAWQETVLEAADFLDGATPVPEEVDAPAVADGEAFDHDGDGKVGGSKKSESKVVTSASLKPKGK